MPQILKVIFGLPSFNPISTSSPFFLPLWPRPIDSVAGRESRVPSILVEWKEEKGVSEGGREGRCKGGEKGGKQSGCGNVRQKREGGSLDSGPLTSSRMTQLRGMPFLWRRPGTHGFNSRRFHLFSYFKFSMEIMIILGGTYARTCAQRLFPMEPAPKSYC